MSIQQQERTVEGSRRQRRYSLIASTVEFQAPLGINRLPVLLQLGVLNRTSAFTGAIFWFLSIISGLSLLSFILFKFFHDTFRRERSLNYQTQRRKAAALSSLSNQTENFNLDLSFADVNPLKPLDQVLRRKNKCYGSYRIW